MTWSPLRNKPGYVGQAIPGMEVKIADDGEMVGSVSGGCVEAAVIDEAREVLEYLPPRDFVMPEGVTPFGNQEG